MLVGLGRPSDEDFAKSENRSRVKLNLDIRQTDFIKTFPENFDKWFNDNFPFRSRIIAFYQILEIGLFKELKSDYNVVVGKNGQLFWGNNFLENINIARNIRNYSDNEGDIFRNNVLDIQRFLERRNVEFYFALVPSKVSVYYEDLPDWAQSKMSKENVYYQAMNILKDEGINHVDLLKYFLELKTDSRVAPYLYWKTDTHWSELGAYYAYKSLIELMAKDFPRLNPITLKSFEISDKGIPGDAARLAKQTKIDDFKLSLNLDYNDHPLRAADQFTRKNINISIDSTYKKEQRRDFYTITNEHCNNKLHVLILGDSYSPELSPFFNRTFYMNTIGDFDQFYGFPSKFASYLISSINVSPKPNAVILEITTRNLIDQALKLFSGIAPKFDDAESEIAFNALKDVIFLLDQDPITQVESVNQAQLLSDNGALVIDFKGPSPSIVLKRIDRIKQDESLILEVELDSPIASSIQIFYQTNENLSYNENNSITIPVHQGENKLYAEIYSYNLNGLLRIAPAPASGKYVIKSLIIKSCPKSFVLPK